MSRNTLSMSLAIAVLFIFESCSTTSDPKPKAAADRAVANLPPPTKRSISQATTVASIESANEKLADGMSLEDALAALGSSAPVSRRSVEWKTAKTEFEDHLLRLGLRFEDLEKDLRKLAEFCHSGLTYACWQATLSGLPADVDNAFSRAGCLGGFDGLCQPPLLNAMSSKNDPSLLAQVEDLCRNGRMGICAPYGSAELEYVRSELYNSSSPCAADNNRCTEEERLKIQTASKYILLACESHSVNACQDLLRERYVDDETYERTKFGLESKCFDAFDRQSLEACDMLATFLRARETEFAARAADESCGRGSAGGCEDLAWIEFRKRNDPEQAYRQIVRLCSFVETPDESCEFVLSHVSYSRDNWNTFLELPSRWWRASPGTGRTPWREVLSR